MLTKLSCASNRINATEPELFTFPEYVGFAGDDSLADRVGQRAGQGGGVPGSNPAHELVAG